VTSDPGWTFGTLEAYLSQRLIDQGIMLGRRMDDADKAIQAALASAEKAVSKAEQATERRFEAVNEFRGQLADQTGTFLPRTEYGAAHAGLVDRINVITERIAAIELRITSRLDSDAGAETGAEAARRRASQLTTAVIGALAVLIALVSTVAYLLKK
jgi:hypothetical protein